MKRTFFLSLALLACISGYSQKSERVNLKRLKNDTIVWQKDSVLSRADFKGRVTPQWSGCASTFLMITPVETNGNMLFSVRAVFIKSKSNIIKTSDYILKHEQLHFDICELFARKLRKTMEETDFTKVKNIVPQIQSMYNKINGEYVRFEEKYDNETNHGENPAKQKLWSDDVANQLKDLDKYSAEDVNVVKN